MKKLRIKRTSFTEARQSDLAVIAETVVNNTKGAAAYLAIRDEVTNLETFKDQFIVSLGDLAIGGPLATIRKNDLRQKVTFSLKTISTTLEELPDVTEELLAGTGLALSNSTPRPAGPPNAPFVLRCEATGVPGEVQVTLKDEFPGSVVIHEAHGSYNKGTNWALVFRATGTRFLIKGLQTCPEFWLQFCSVGAGENNASTLTMRIELSVP